ncbi:MAG: exodeoxyribonuclease VII large subunit [endosymbiont of Seepiophila jonesi]|uniref:Exodeoxyribonuclease 7 large subunit n=1 Tax=endosymbiont of Lamellibrachia luymesi TaxID=2200907 RepID=A0A370DZT3_9GAMM|nr:MAG: exodeoxyribonuclease VII large subunit [endosymbiont of Lamellibrachia luymesi]RDH94399.1 MAG: exodeoxyribonuclease VII large subunit [endosymbiont of Seepiophila jonesi]
MQPELNNQRDIYSISRLVRETRAVLEGSFPLLWIEGEISNLAKPASGHIYFSLKDEAAQVRCAMFRMKRQRLRFQPENGQQVLIRARISLYEARGEFQLIAEHMEPSGEGALRLAFDLLKQKLADEGLFDSRHKQPLPSLPGQIGLITSPSGAAVRDLLTVLQRRFPAIPVVIYPVAVQGREAPAQIIRKIELANRRAECDLLILSRGGGSLEDLQAFNDEQVARAVYASRIPLVTGIGHEIDFTIADFVADQRAATPSAAAELVSPDQAAWRLRLQRLQQQMTLRWQQQFTNLQIRLRSLSGRLERQHVGQRLLQRSQRLDELTQRLHQIQRQLAERQQSRLQSLQNRLLAQSPERQIERLKFSHKTLQSRLRQQIEGRIVGQHNRLSQLARDLHTLSPLNTLERGYAIVSREKNGQIIHAADEVAVGDTVKARVAKGQLICQVTSVG